MSTNVDIIHLYHGESQSRYYDNLSFQLNEPERIKSFLIVDFIPNEETHTITVEFPLMISEVMWFKFLPEILREEKNVKRLVMPLQSSSSPILVKSFKKLLSYNDGLCLQEKLRRIVVKNKKVDSEVCYTGPGIILDKDYSPLLFITYTYTIKYVQLETNVFKPLVAMPNKINCYVHPKVYLEPSVYIHKGIKDYWCTPGFTTSLMLYAIYPYSRKSTCIDCKIDTIISERINDFFHAIPEPEHEIDRKTMNLCINEYLDAYADDMFHTLYYEY